VVLFVAENGGELIKVAINSDTLVTTQGVTGTKVVTPSNVLTCIKTTATKWICYLANDILSPAEQIAVAHSTSPFITAYPWSNSGFGTKYSDLSPTLPGQATHAANFSTDGNTLFLTSGDSYMSPITFTFTVELYAYAWNNSTGFGSKLATLTVAPGTRTIRDINSVNF
jgi:hypothetical protein